MLAYSTGMSIYGTGMPIYGIKKARYLSGIGPRALDYGMIILPVFPVLLRQVRGYGHAQFPAYLYSTTVRQGKAHS